MSGYIYIDRQNQLDLAVNSVKDSPCIGVDTESSGFYTYEPELCLIQISASGHNYIIDTLVNLDLTALGEVFGNPSIIKIFHSAASDIAEMRRLYDWKFSNVHDTFIACRMLGLEGCSLATLVEEHCQVKLQKGEQKSNWKKRPLTPSQLEYAHYDTVYLEKVMKSLEYMLEKRNLLELYEDEVNWSINIESPEPRVINPDGWMHIQGALNLGPAQRGYLRALYLFREEKAKRMNITPFRLISNFEMVSMAKQCVTDPERLRIHPRLLKNDAETLIQLLRKADPVTNEDLPAFEKPDPVIEERMRRLKKWRNDFSREKGMDTSVIISNKALRVIAGEYPADHESLRALKVMSDLKVRLYGEDILRALKNEMP